MTNPLTPACFAADPVRIDVLGERYDWSSQTMEGVPAASSTTYRATQTYDHKGMPKDNDND